MPINKELEEKRKKEAEELSRAFTLNDLQQFNFNNNFNYYIEEPTLNLEEPSLNEEIKNENEVLDAEVKDVEEPVKEDVVEESNVEENQQQEEVNGKFATLIQKDIEETNKALDEIKKQHPKDYDSYIEGLRKTKYYQERLKYWKEYYANIKKELETESQKDADLHAREQAQKEELAENTEAPFFEEKKFSGVVHGEGAYQTKLSMVADPSLKDTIEQILLNDLYNSLDKYRSYYKSGKAVPNTNGISAKMKEAMHKINAARTEFAVALFGSYSEVFNTADNKRVKKPYMPTIKAVQKRIASKKSDLTMPDVADVVMDRFYHVENGKITGIIPTLAEELTIKVQKELIKRGQYNFNLCQDAAKEVLKNISTESQIVDRIVSDAAESNLYLEEIKNVDELFVKFRQGLLENKVNVNNEYLEEYGKYLQRMSDEHEDQQYLFDRLAMSLDNLKLLSVNAQAVLGKENVEMQEVKALINSIDKERKYLKETKDVNNLFENKSIESFASSNKTAGTQALTDKLIMDSLKMVGAYTSMNELNNFQFTEEQCQKETESLLNFAKNERNVSVDVNLAMLFNIGTIVSDIREKFKYASENPNKVRYIDKEGQEKQKSVAYGENSKDAERYAVIADKAQSLLNNELSDAMSMLSTKENDATLSASEQELVNKALNSFIALSKLTRKSERRKEVGLEKTL